MEGQQDIQLPLPLGMKEVKVIDIEENDGSLTILLQKTLELGICPQCGTISQKVKDYHIHKVTDRPVFENGVVIQILKRRWKCLNDFCEINTFTEEIEGLPKKHTHTESFYREVYQLSRRMTYTDVYKHFRDARCQVSLSNVYQKAQEQLRKRVIVPEVVWTQFIGLDEFSKGKEHDYGVVLTNLECNKVIDLTDGGKTKKAASKLLDKVDADRVKACAIDMWEPFRDAVIENLPDADVVVDRFHVIKEVNQSLDKVRKRARKHFKSKQKKHAVFKYKELLLMGMENLSPMQEERLWEILSWNKDLCRAYELKEILRAIYVEEDSKKAEQELDNWISETNACGIPEMVDVAQTIINWKREILNFWVHRITNAVTEGKVNKIKALRRKAYNYNNFQSLRLKILEQE